MGLPLLGGTTSMWTVKKGIGKEVDLVAFTNEGFGKFGCPGGGVRMSDGTNVSVVVEASSSRVSITAIVIVPVVIVVLVYLVRWILILIGH